MVNTIWTVIYTLGLLSLGIFGLQALALMFLFFRHRNRTSSPPPPPEKWPRVTVQLPIFNERFVVKRLIDAVCALDYPRESLSIQVLDDSTDSTTEVAQKRVDLHQKRGIHIELLHRTHRAGFKGGALATALQKARGDLLAVFDADFVPQPDFLKRMVPYLTENPKVGMVQARWGHLNADQNLLTRTQALSLDGQFVVVQQARYLGDLFVKFNGSAGIWRRSCIEDAGGWEGDTLTEDLDLSFRAQLNGWRFVFVPEVVVPAQIPTQLTAFKRQQYRWAHGSVRTLLKLRKLLWRAPKPLLQRIDGLVHLSAYLSYLIMLILLVVCTPITLALGIETPSLPWFSVLGVGGPGLILLAQWVTYPDWKRRAAYLPVLFLLGVGLGLNNTLAVAAAMTGREKPFNRTPKFRLDAPPDGQWMSAYLLSTDWTVWGELVLAIYTAVALTFALRYEPRLIPPLALVSLGFGFMGGMGLLETWFIRRSSTVPKDTTGRYPFEP